MKPKDSRMNFNRNSGILCHVSSLPATDGIGNLGEASRHWIDILDELKCRYWQMLPLGPTGFGDSPYQVFSAFAGNPMLISLHDFVESGIFTKKEITPPYVVETDLVQFFELNKWKEPKLRDLFQRLKKKNDKTFLSQKAAFSNENAFWLDEYCLFMALKNRFNGHPWHMWPHEYRFRAADALAQTKIELADEIEYHEYIQFIFHQQCLRTCQYAKEKNIELIGDIPLYVAFDSADVWSAPDHFQLNQDNIPAFVAGVPPDYFSATGQRWGNPVYRWDILADQDFNWWVKRVSHALKYMDVIRLDHFRGLAAYYAIPSIYHTAENGQWIPAPGMQLLQTINDNLGNLPFIAEDLGVITPDVIELRDAYHLPGMRIFQFGFGVMEENIHKPSTYIENCVAYTGTHDNETTLGWYKLQSEEVKQQVLSYLDIEESADLVHQCIRSLWSSEASLTISPLQDFLQLDNTARMNLPGTVGGTNWRWKLRNWQQIDPILGFVKEINKEFQRENIK
ncbi:MAG: 4-alpha-glucanotransferase [Anaerolineaceae bacterium]|nr:4-alpha-glucanotransferase [Anaerolineaceae bacterium]